MTLVPRFDRSLFHGSAAVLSIAALSAVPLAAQAGNGEASTQPAPVHFASSCTAEVEAEIDHAVTMLHSIAYPETTRLFAEIIAREPDCAIAYWGAAMSLWHPLWAPPSAADLERGRALLATTADLETTPREAAYLEALAAFFSSTDTGTHRDRAGEFERRMARVYSENLDDPEAALSYALSLLATADPDGSALAEGYLETVRAQTGSGDRDRARLAAAWATGGGR